MFTNVISGLQKNYPKDKLEEISTSFCFICLLHLANEQGLKLETGTEEHDAEDEKRVGNIWDLKVLNSVVRCSIPRPSVLIASLDFLLRFIEIRPRHLLHSLVLFGFLLDFQVLSYLHPIHISLLLSISLLTFGSTCSTSLLVLK